MNELFVRKQHNNEIHLALLSDAHIIRTTISKADDQMQDKKIAFLGSANKQAKLLAMAGYIKIATASRNQIAEVARIFGKVRSDSFNGFSLSEKNRHIIKKLCEASGIEAPDFDRPCETDMELAELARAHKAKRKSWAW